MTNFVTSVHATFGRKLARLRGFVKDALLNENANENHQKNKLYKLAFLDFRNLDFLTPQMPIKSYFLFFGRLTLK